MTTHDVFEQRAASAGAALRAAFPEEGSMSTSQERKQIRTTDAGQAAGVGRRTPRSGPPRRTLAAAAALVAAAVSAGVFVLTGTDEDPADVLTPPAERERAVLTQPYLTASGTLPDRPVQSVHDVPVPFTFSSPLADPQARPWRYRIAADIFDMGNLEAGMRVLTPTETYAPDVPWTEQTALVPAPSDRAGWAQWLEETGQVEVTARRELLIGGAPATRFTLDLGQLPTAYQGCGGGRTCLAIAPMLDPTVGPPRVGVGPQEGIDEETAEMTVIEVEDRAVLVVTGGDPDSRDGWLPTLRTVIDSLRFG